jgi:hypothetical protein
MEVNRQRVLDDRRRGDSLEVRGRNRRIVQIAKRSVSWLVLLAYYYRGRQDKEDEIGGACDTHGKKNEDFGVG